MIIDGHVHPSVYEDAGWARTPAPIEKIIEEMNGPFVIDGEERMVDMALCQPAAWETIYHAENHGYGFFEQHSYVIECVRRFPDRIIGCMNLNPRFGVAKGLTVLEELISTKGFRALKLHANHHVYRPEAAQKLLNPIFDKASRLRIPVLIHTGDTPFSSPAQWAEYIERYREVNVILCHYATQMISYAYEAVYIAKKNPNVYLEIGWAPQSRLREGVITLGDDRLIFGTDTPPNEMSVWIKMVESMMKDPPLGSSLSREGLRRILGENLKGLLRL